MDKEFIKSLVFTLLYLGTVIVVISRMCACEEATHVKDTTVVMSRQ